MTAREKLLNELTNIEEERTEKEVKEDEIINLDMYFAIYNERQLNSLKESLKDCKLNIKFYEYKNRKYIKLSYTNNIAQIITKKIIMNLESAMKRDTHKLNKLDHYKELNIELKI